MKEKVESLQLLQGLVRFWAKIGCQIPHLKTIGWMDIDRMRRERLDTDLLGLTLLLAGGDSIPEQKPFCL
jgi:hypothetical protein